MESLARLYRSYYWHLWLEATVLAAFLLLVVSHRAARILEARPVAGWGRRLASRRRLAVALLFVVCLLGQAVALPALQYPEPGTHDEFSYLLAAKTFAAGRLTNPPHPFWQHFETFHVLSQPTYTSMYPPGQSLVLALGIKLFDDPLSGVRLSVAAAFAATCWMLIGYLPAGWALLGSLLGFLRFGLFSYWSASYWGGAVAMAGGALVLGAVPRIRARPHPADGVTLALGLGILANTRPFEGLFLSVPVVAWLALWLLRPGGEARRRRLLLVGVPVLVVLSTTAVLMGFYNRAVTGSAWTLPYALARQTYAAASPFIWSRPGPLPPIRHEVMRRFYESWEPSIQGARSLSGLLDSAWGKLTGLWPFFVGPALSPVLLFLPAALARRRLRLPVLAAASSFSGHLLVAWPLYPHYAAPLAPVLVLLLTQALRHLRALTIRGSRIGRRLAAAVVATCVASAGLGLVYRHAGAEFPMWPLTWYQSTVRPLMPRGEMLRWLQAVPGNHLVFVHYGPEHEPHFEWVQNEPDIDHARVVWAREMGPEEDRKLIEYFRDRKVWRLDADQVPPSLVPLASGESPGLPRR